MTELDDQHEEMRGRRGWRKSGGASVQIRDSRVTQVLSWFWAALGTAFVGGIYWGASSINTLNESVVKILAQNEAVFRRLDRVESVDDRQDMELGEQARDIGELRGKNLRGGPPVGRR